MKLLFKFVLSLVTTICFLGAVAQDPTIQVLTLNSGVVAVGETVFLQVRVGNNLPTPVPANKIRIGVSAPPSVTLNSAQTILPAGFVICSNAGGTIIISNGSTTITQSTPQTILVAMVGTTVTPSQTVTGGILFAGGTVATRCNNGPSIGTNVPANDNGTSTVTVTATTPLTLVSFNATLNNCIPSFKWVTESEINTDRFEIESNQFNNNGNWKTVGEVSAKGSLSTNNYSFEDNTVYTSSNKILYRLKMIDKDGSFKYSDVLPLQIDCKQILVQAYPNPVQDGKLYVNVNGAIGKTEGILLSVSGQIISRKPVTNGTNFMDVSGVSNGTYILNIVGTNGVDKKVKVIINK